MGLTPILSSSGNPLGRISYISGYVRIILLSNRLLFVVPRFIGAYKIRMNAALQTLVLMLSAKLPDFLSPRTNLVRHRY